MSLPSPVCYVEDDSNNSKFFYFIFLLSFIDLLKINFDLVYILSFNFKTFFRFDICSLKVFAESYLITFDTQLFRLKRQNLLVCQIRFNQ